MVTVSEDNNGNSFCLEFFANLYIMPSANVSFVMDDCFEQEPPKNHFEDCNCDCACKK